MNILFVGDVFGKPGRSALEMKLREYRASMQPDLVIVNCENAAAGFGMTEPILKEMLGWGADVLTSGNHIWDKREFTQMLDSHANVLRPANYPSSAPGRGWATIDRCGRRVCVISLQGRAFMPAEVESPFETMDKIFDTVDADIYFVDFHAEATAEKIAVARYIDSRAAALVGTHTHVQTADDTILPGGTAYISDVGMTGGHAGVIGMTYDSVMPKFLTSVPSKFEVEKRGVRFQGVEIEIDEETGRALAIHRIDEPMPEGGAE